MIAAVAIIIFSSSQLLQPLPTQSERPNDLVPLSTDAEINTFDLEQVLAAKEGDIIGVRGESLVITDGVKHLVPLEDISHVIAPDTIRSIDNLSLIHI